MVADKDERARQFCYVCCVATLHFLFAPGAGAPASHSWMQHWSALLRTFGTVSTLDYPYMREGRKRPDLLRTLIAAHRAALNEARAQQDGPVILIGKSMGSRIGCHVSLEEETAALICFGYPLCGGGDPSKLRDKVLREISTPILFIQGTRDSLCPLELLEPIRRAMQAPSELHLVEGGDHSLAVTKRQLKAASETQADADQRILRAIQTFVARHVTAASRSCRPGLPTGRAVDVASSNPPPSLT